MQSREQKRNTSLKDLAAEAGVSIRTVSRVLKNNGYVDAATRARIETAIRRLPYQPNLAARALRTGRSRDITVLLGSMDELHIAKLEAFETALRAGGYRTVTRFAHSTDAVSEQALVDELMLQRPAGLAVFPAVSHTLCQTLHRRLAAADLPHVFIDCAPGEQWDVVGIDRPRGVYHAVKHLAATGRKRIAYLGPDDPSRLDGYRQAMSELGHPPILILLPGEQACDVTPFLEHRPRPDAVQVHSDVMAMRLLDALHETNIRVPEDVAVVSFDNRFFAALASPSLTTVAQPNRAVGEAAAEILLNRINGEPPPAGGTYRMMPTKLIRRRSA